MLGIVVVLVMGMLGISKWVSTFEENVNSSAGGGVIEVNVENEQAMTWQEEAELDIASITQMLETEQDLSKIERADFEERVQMLQYRLDKDVEPLGQFSRESIIIDSSGVASIVLLLTVIVAAGIVASEFSQGTIKMLLTRPVKRWKILLSKFITVNIFGIFFLMIGYVVMVAVAFILFDSSDGTALVVAGGKVVEASIWGKSLYMLLLASASIFVTATFAFMIGSVFRSSSLAIGLSLFIYFTGSTVTMLLARFDVAKYLVFTHMDLTQYETGYYMIPDMSMPFSLTVLAIYVIIFLVTSFITFVKRDVTA